MKKIMLALLVLSAPMAAQAFVCDAVSTVNPARGQGVSPFLPEAQEIAINECLEFGGFQCVIIACE